MKAGFFGISLTYHGRGINVEIPFLNLASDFVLDRANIFSEIYRIIKGCPYWFPNFLTDPYNY